MLAHNLKDILSLIPEAFELVKQASLEEDFPTDNKDSVCASYLRIGYLTKVAHKSVSPETVEFVTKAAMLYGVKDKMDELSLAFNPKMEKSASERSEELQVEFEASLNGFMSIEKTASIAERLSDEFTHQSEQVRRYSGNAWLNKEAAVKTLANRYYATKNADFVKIAKLVGESVREDDFSSIRDVCRTVTQLDKRAGLDVIGFNFYREALMTKEAEMKTCLAINLAGNSVPYEKIEALGKERIGSLVGADVSKAMTGGPVNDKYVLESLPRDLQLIIVSATKGI